MGVRVAELIVNQVLLQDESVRVPQPARSSAFYWYAERISEQRVVLDELDAAIGDVALVLTPHLSGEPIGRQGAGRTAGQRPPPGGALPPVLSAPDRDLESGSAWSRCTDCD